MSIRAWERFLGSGDADDISGSVPDIIADSWLRSHELGVAAEDLHVPHFEVDTHSAFVATAAPVLLGMSDLLLGSSTSLALTDRAGTVVWRWDSESSITRALDATEVELGSSMREATTGTNGIAIAAVLERPATVIGTEHYKSAWHRWACAASPVFHPVSRQMVGVVNVACKAEDANHLLNVAVRSMAREIQATLRSTATLPEQRLLAAHLKRRSLTSNPVVTVNDRTLIVDDDGLRINLNHSAVWNAVCEAARSDTVLQIAPGVRARIHRVLPGRPDAGVTLEILHAEQHHDSASGAASTSAHSGLTGLELAEMRVIREALQRHSGNKQAAAQELGISRGTLYARIRRYRINPG